MNTIRSLITGATVVAAGAGAAAALAATGSAAAGTAALPKPGSFTLRAHHGSESSLDLGAHGFSAGDQDLFTGPLTRKGAAAGSFVGTCTTARVDRARHVITENDRTLACADLLRTGQIRQIGPLLSASHASLRDDFEVSVRSWNWRSR